MDRLQLILSNDAVRKPVLTWRRRLVEYLCFLKIEFNHKAFGSHCEAGRGGEQRFFCVRNKDSLVGKAEVLDQLLQDIRVNF